MASKCAQIPFSGIGNFCLRKPVRPDWALFAGGVMEFRRDQWCNIRRRISAEIHPAQLRISILPLLPAERDHVLALLPNRLLITTPAKRTTAAQGRETRLGRFNERLKHATAGPGLPEATAWRSCRRDPALSAESRWQEILPDPSGEPKT